MKHGEKVAIVIGEEPPVVAVNYNDERERPGNDSGFDIVLSDAPDDPTTLGVEGLRTACLHCIIEAYPDVGRGMDLARKHGWAERDPETGEWSV